MGQPLKICTYTHTLVLSLGFGGDLGSEITVKGAEIFQGLSYTDLLEAGGGGRRYAQEILYSMGSAAHVIFVKPLSRVCFQKTQFHP